MGKKRKRERENTTTLFQGVREKWEKTAGSSKVLEGLFFFFHEELVLGVGEFELGLLLPRLQEETESRKEGDHQGQDDEGVSGDHDDVRGGEDRSLDRHLSFLLFFVFCFSITNKTKTKTKNKKRRRRRRWPQQEHGRR